MVEKWENYALLADSGGFFNSSVAGVAAADGLATSGCNIGRFHMRN